MYHLAKSVKRVQGGSTGGHIRQFGERGTFGPGFNVRVAPADGLAFAQMKRVTFGVEQTENVVKLNQAVSA